jgi:hypothetical protein
MIARTARWTAIAIAVAAIVDPRIPLPRAERPVVRVVSAETRDLSPITQALTNAGFRIDPASREAATVFVGSAPRTSRVAPGSELWALDTSPPAPNVRVVRAAPPGSRLPAQAVDVQVEIAADGLAGQTTNLVLEHAGIAVAHAAHKWAPGEERWAATLRYLPPGVSATTLRVRASAAAGESSLDDNAADLQVPGVRGPSRVLIVEAAVTWPAAFVRRALEGEPAIAVSSLQRAAKAVATRAGDPPKALTRSTLAPFESVIIGGPEELTAADVEALRWFVERRGGVAVFVPDRAPAGRYLDLIGVASFSPRALEAPAQVGKLQASELVVPARLPPAATVHAAAENAPVVFSARRGAGAIVFSGALDAWRQRGDAFAEFWRGLLVAAAAAVPPALDVMVSPAVVRPGESATVSARLRDLPEGDVVALPPLMARAVSPEAKVDAPIRLWPTAAPGVYEGEWRPASPGAYDIAVTAGEWRGDATATVTPSVVHASAADSDALALAAGATGGRAFPVSDVSGLVASMRDAHPPQRTVRAGRPMRSPWWMVPFAALLCVEWAVRRKRGLS